MALFNTNYYRKTTELLNIKFSIRYLSWKEISQGLQQTVSSMQASKCVDKSVHIKKPESNPPLLRKKLSPRIKLLPDDVRVGIRQTLNNLTKNDEPTTLNTYDAKCVLCAKTRRNTPCRLIYNGLSRG